MPIRFYSTRGPFGAFSNFSAHAFTLDERVWKTSEHYFQAKKFEGTPHEEEIRLAPTPMRAAQMGRDRKRPLRRDWEGVKEQVMRAALQAKFTQHAELKELLLSTGSEPLIEDSPTDFYWGIGRDGSGKNRLGALLVELRGALIAEVKRGR